MSTKLRNGRARYVSTATMKTIAKFQLSTLREATLHEKSASFEKLGHVYLNFPVLIQGNGCPWDVGNLYLLKKLQRTIQYNHKTFKSMATHLLDYLRFLEDEDLDCLKFNKIKRLNPIFRYRIRLIEQIDSGLISVSSARSRINAAVNFYRLLITEGIINHQNCDIPFQDVYKTIMLDNEFGARRQLTIKSHDLAIHVPSKAKNSETINDGDELRPLTVNEQAAVLKALQKSSRVYQLIFYLALFTGARLQTICTLRLKHLHREADAHGFIRLPIGGGTGIDTKFQKPMTLLIPDWLVQDIKIYAKSEQARLRREKFKYGDNEENYIFLTKLGTPFYTSKAEENDLSGIIAAADGSAERIKIHQGEAIRSYLKTVLLPAIRLIDSSFQDFKFHDLRASFGMNLLESQLQSLSAGYSTLAAVEYVQARMSHKNKNTTLQYLNYKSRLQWRNKIQHEYEAGLMQYVISTSAKAGGGI